MDPARPTDPDPADPFFPERADHAIMETIEIATEGENHHQAVRKLRGPLMKIKGVHDVKIDTDNAATLKTFVHDRLRNFFVRFCESGYKHSAICDVEVRVARR